MNTREIFGQALRRIRKDRGTPAKMLADELKMSESPLFQLERAELRPNPDDGPNIDAFYGVPAELYTWLAEISRTAREPSAACSPTRRVQGQSASGSRG